MGKSSVEKLEDYLKLHIKVGNSIIGEGFRGVMLPMRLRVLLVWGIGMEIVHINGINHNLHNFPNLCNVLATYALIFQLLLHVINRFSGNELQQLDDNHNALKNFFAKEQKDKNCSKMLESSVDRAVYALKLHLIVSFVLYHTPITTSWIVSYIQQDHIMAFHFYVPNIDQNSTFGFVVNQLVTNVATTLFFMLFMARDMNFIFYPLQTVAFTDVFAHKLKIFDNQLQEFNKPKPLIDLPGPSRPTMQNAILEVLRKIQHQKELDELENKLIEMIKHFELYNKYIDNLNSYCTASLFTAISTNSAALSLTMLSMRLVSIPIGMALSILLAFQVFVPCVIGTVVSNQNAKIVEAICNFHWYELSTKKRKIYLQFIHQCQNANEFNLPIFGDLNMELFTSVMNTSYSYLAYLFNFT